MLAHPSSRSRKASRPGNGRGPGSRRSLGFTILELLVAVSLLAVLALLSWRGMSSVIAGRDSIVERSDELRALTIVMSQMEEDLRRAWPVRLLELSVPSVSFTIGDEREPPSLTLLREAPGDAATQVQRVIWRLRDGSLERGFSAWGVPVPGDTNPVPDIPFTWQPIVGGVEAMELRGWLQGRGWLPASSIATSQAAEQSAQAARSAPGAPGGPAAAIVPAAAGTLVTGVELVLVRRGERIVRVFAVGD